MKGSFSSRSDAGNGLNPIPYLFEAEVAIFRSATEIRQDHRPLIVYGSGFRGRKSCKLASASYKVSISFTVYPYPGSFLLVSVP